LAKAVGAKAGGAARTADARSITRRKRDETSFMAGYPLTTVKAEL
jgi:hypothetical protein